MKTYRVGWIYYGINGAEEGYTRVEAESPEAAEDVFYRYNRFYLKDDRHIGYSVECIEEEEE